MKKSLFKFTNVFVAKHISVFIFSCICLCLILLDSLLYTVEHFKVTKPNKNQLRLTYMKVEFIDSYNKSSSIRAGCSVSLPYFPLFWLYLVVPRNSMISAFGYKITAVPCVGELSDKDSYYHLPWLCHMIIHESITLTEGLAVSNGHKQIRHIPRS